MITTQAIFWLRIIYPNERKSEQAHIPHAPTLLQNAVYNGDVFGSRIEMFSVVSQSYVSNSSQSVSKIQPMKLHYD